MEYLLVERKVSFKSSFPLVSCFRKVEQAVEDDLDDADYEEGDSREEKRQPN